MNKRVETLWTLGLKEASLSPINTKKFMQQEYLSEVVDEFFSIDKRHPLVEKKNDNSEFVEKMFNSEVVDSNNMSSFYYKNQANVTEHLFLQLDVVPGSNALL